MIDNIAAGVEAFTSNAFVVSGPPGADAPSTDDGDAGRRTLVDTGTDFDAVSAIRDRVPTLDAVVLTHTHPDHVGNVDAVRDAFGVETWGFDASTPWVDNELPGGDTIRMGTAEYEALYTPGHADDHLCLYAPDAGVLFAGDLVFGGGAFGRTDFEGADRATLIDSIDRVEERVGDGLRELHAGHGASVTDDPAGDVAAAARAARTR